MTSMGNIAALAAALSVMATTGTLSRALQPSASDLMARSVRAHGGERLSSWQTFTLKGTVEMQDGITYKAAYRVYAKLPGKLRVEQDMTADRGRIFTEYFLNDNVAWSRRNLIPGKADLSQLQRWMNQCYGIAHYARHAKSLTLKPDAAVEQRARSEGGAFAVVATRPAYVIAAEMDEGIVELSLDKESFYLLQEATAGRRRIYRDFRTFDGTVWATQILEVTAGRQGEVITPYTIQEITYNTPIADWMFEEDRPPKH